LERVRQAWLVQKLILFTLVMVNPPGLRTMANIIAGRFDTFEHAGTVAKELQIEGVSDDDVWIVYVTSPGQHDHTPIGGDAIADEGAKAAHKGAGKGIVIGGVIGGAIGAASVVLINIPWIVIAVGIGLGAYIGSLSGAMSRTRQSQSETQPPDTSSELVRKAGVMLAINAVDVSEERLIEALRAHGAAEIERANGQWSEGEWKDFDPTKSPEFV
uniref:hypothetical protein n=1 Tax=Caballeronia sp. BR00000012568055 TaxID=2918761 RepID=UPI0023F980BC